MSSGSVDENILECFAPNLAKIGTDSRLAFMGLNVIAVKIQ